jgi:hypothetical protein
MKVEKADENMALAPSISNESLEPLRRLLQLAA